LFPPNVILKLKCTQFDFCSKPRWGSLQRSPRSPSLDLRGPTSNGREGRKDRREGQGSGKERRGPTSKARLRRKGRGEEGRKGREG